MKTGERNPGKGSIDLCEEATFLLRQAPVAVWAYYFLGTMPFLLALLYFWSDLTRGQQAGDRLALGSLVLALLFIWMKTWQAAFAARLRDVITDTEPLRISARGWMRTAVDQARWQPWGLLLLPISSVLAFPFGWVYAYYQNLVALGTKSMNSKQDGRGTGEISIHAAAVEQAKLWPQQNHLLLLILSGLFIFVFVNMAIALVLVPRILITFFGVKEIFEPSFWLIANTTFLAVVTVITHLVLDPFIKTLYVLRCFYGESQTTGQDLRVRMIRAARSERAAALGLLAFALISFAPSSAAAEHAEELNTAISEVLNQPEYKWKFPREIVPQENDGPLADFLANVGQALRRAGRAFIDWIGAVIDWLDKKFGREPSTGKGGWGLGDPQTLLYLCLTAVVVLLAILIWRNRSSFRRNSLMVVAETAPPIPDLRSDDVAADALPEDEWLKLAEQMRLSGDLRLAIRALFLAALADLARRQVVSIAKFKSNRDYQRELARRSAAVPQRSASFSVLTGIYERVWYGLYEPSGNMFAECEENVRVLKTC
jgi:hypothetical protein